MRSVSAAHVRARARQTFWLVPAGCVLVALALALGLPQLDVRLHTARVLFPGGPESARSFLSSVTTAMISITALVFSITIVALQLAAGRFSSRVMHDAAEQNRPSTTVRCTDPDRVPPFAVQTRSSR